MDEEDLENLWRDY